MNTLFEAYNSESNDFPLIGFYISDIGPFAEKIVECLDIKGKKSGKVSLLLVDLLGGGVASHMLSVEDLKKYRMVPRSLFTIEQNLALKERWQDYEMLKN